MGVGYDDDIDQDRALEECPLDDGLRLVAKQELREDDVIRAHSLRAMRNWIRKHPDIVTCRTDTPFLLRFLRTKKFSVPMAQDMLERYLVVRQLYPQWFSKLDVDDSVLSDILDSGYLVPLSGRDEFGRCVMFSCVGRFDPYKYTSADMARVHTLISESLMDDSENQIKGYSYVNDESGLLMGHMTLWSFSDIKRIIRCLQSSTPMRHKSTYFINVPNFADKFFTAIVSFLNSKLKSRVKFFSGQKDLQKFIDPKYLPKEYGGEIPLNTMIADLKKKLRAKREMLLALDDMKINVNGKGKIISEFDDTQTELTGSFRKLEVD